MGHPPVVVFAYNRPAHLALLFESLHACPGHERHEFIVYCDYPRKASDAQAVEEVIQVAETFCASLPKATIVKRPHNMGFNNIVHGISEVLEKHEHAIILEDDLYVSPDFLLCMTTMLDHYRLDDDVWMVSAHAPWAGISLRYDACLIHSARIWGWGVWRRSWVHYDADPALSVEALSTLGRRIRFDVSAGFGSSWILKDVTQGSIQTWDTQWSLNIFSARAYGVHPWRSLTWNTGRQSGEHGAKDAPVPPEVPPKRFRRPRMSVNPRLPPVGRTTGAAALIGTIQYVLGLFGFLFRLRRRR